MAIVSMRSKKRMLELSISALLCYIAFLMQMLCLNYLGIHGITCDLPLTLIIVWGLVFGSGLPNLTPRELRRQSLGEVFRRQMASGSHSGFLVGWFFSWLYFNIQPIYSVKFPLIGWISGYFCLRGLGQGNLLAIPMTFILTILAEVIMSWQLVLCHAGALDISRPAMLFSGDWTKMVFEHLNIIILPEALLNSIIAPFLYFPMRRWYEMLEGQQQSIPLDD